MYSYGMEVEDLPDQSRQEVTDHNSRKTQAVSSSIVQFPAMVGQHQKTLSSPIAAVELIEELSNFGGST